MNSAMPADAAFSIKLLEHVRACLAAPERTSLQHALDWLAELEPYRSAIICTVRPVPEPVVTCTFNHSYRNNWLNQYTHSHFERVDPIVRAASRKRGLMTWQEACHRFAGKAEREFLTAAADHGLRDGVVYAWSRTPHDVAAPITFCSIASDSSTYSPQFLYALDTLVPVFGSMGLKAETVGSELLTTREREVLKWACAGKTVWEAATILGLSDATIKFHLKNTYSKLQVSSRAQAVAAAIDLGIL